MGCDADLPVFWCLDERGWNDEDRNDENRCSTREVTGELAFLPQQSVAALTRHLCSGVYVLCLLVRLSPDRFGEERISMAVAQLLLVVVQGRKSQHGARLTRAWPYYTALAFSAVAAIGNCNPGHVCRSSCAV